MKHDTITPEPGSRRPVLHWLLLAVAAVVVALAWLKPLDQGAENHLKAGLKRALATYAVARTINGVVSVAQETGVSVQPGGVGMTFAPGQLLDPINDLVEQVSSVMLAVSVSFGIQLLLLHLGGSALVSAVMTAAVLTCVVLWWRRTPIPRWAWRLLAAIVFIRFAVPLAASGSEMAYQSAMANEYAAAQAELEGSQAATPPASPASAGAAGSAGSPAQGFWDILKAVPKWSESKDDARERGRIEQLKDRLDAVVEHLIRLVAIFVVQTVLLPLLFVGLLGRLLLALVAPRGRQT
ncbi:MAG TPA: hypothetical protein VF169_23535 [Albitalea sp.]|uniref:hypothetical protein n=1 Tax=Piscinibacter sp. TaxID=1903157 RepID=UPI002ED63366